jgi:hypothetical protein
MALLWQTWYLLNGAVFSYDGGDGALPPVHTARRKDVARTAEDANSAGTVVMLLSASSKTVLGVAHELKVRCGRSEAARQGLSRSGRHVRGTVSAPLGRSMRCCCVRMPETSRLVSRSKRVASERGRSSLWTLEVEKALRTSLGREPVLVGSTPLARRTENPNSRAVQVLFRRGQRSDCCKYWCGQVLLQTKKLRGTDSRQTGQSRDSVCMASGWKRSVRSGMLG